MMSRQRDGRNAQGELDHEAGQDYVYLVEEKLAEIDRACSAARTFLFFLQKDKS